MSDTPRWLFGPLEDNQLEGYRLDPKKSRRELFQRIFALWIFWGRSDSICRHCIDCYFVSGSNWYNQVFFHGHQSRPIGNYLERAEKIPNASNTSGTIEIFDPHSGISGPTSRRASACPDLHEWCTQPAHVRCPVAQLLIKPKSDGLTGLPCEFGK